jgi:serine/threonine-protein kinase
MRLSVDLGPEIAFTDGGLQNVLAISPDGRHLAFTAPGPDGVMRLAMRLLDQSRSTLLEGTENAQGPFFSPDSQWIGFFADEKLKKISTRGGAPVILSDAPGPRGASWGDDGNIIAALALGNDGLSRIPAAGGMPKKIRETTTAKRSIHRWPQVLPGSRWVLFTSYQLSDHPDDASIVILSLTTGETKTIARGYFGRILPSGHLVFVRQNTLFAAPLDVANWTVTATPQPVLEDVSGAAYSGARNFDFSQDGVFIYLSGTVGGHQIISSLDGSNHLQRLLAEPGQYYHPRFSPDGKRLAYAVATGHGMEIWVEDLDRGTASPISLLPGRSWWPIWTADATRIVFSSGNGSRHDIFSVRADGMGEIQPLANDDVQGIPRSFSPDDKLLLFDNTKEITSGNEIWIASLTGDTEHLRIRSATRLLDAATPVADAQFSPDGRWIAYVSAELGSTEVFVRSSAGQRGRWQISTGGGHFPIWSRNGRDLFFLGLDQRIRVVNYRAGEKSFVPSTPRLWSNVRVADLGVNSSYDLAPDGKRFVAVLRSGNAGEAEPDARLTVMVNFFDQLRAIFERN